MASVRNGLKTTIDRLGIKQAELARESGISYSTINAVYRRKRNPSKAYKVRIVNAVISLSNETIDPKSIFTSLGSGPGGA